MGWMIGSAMVLLAIAAGLGLLARYATSQMSLATVLLTLYAASWSTLLGVMSLALFSVWWFLGWRRTEHIRAIMRRNAEGGVLAPVRDRREDRSRRAA